MGKIFKNDNFSETTESFKNKLGWSVLWVIIYKMCVFLGEPNCFSLENCLSLNKDVHMVMDRKFILKKIFPQKFGLLNFKKLLYKRSNF
jgi:hypothetical protein